MNSLQFDDATLTSLARELDEVDRKIRDDLGHHDASYIFSIIRIQRVFSIAGRVCIPLGFLTPSLWVLGVIYLSIAKILDNMEIGHNILHGQYDWMNHEHMNSRNFDWDIVCSVESWKRVHNYEHHTYTNIIGKDRDFGYGLLRMTDKLKWKVKNLWQFFTYALLSLLFEWGIAYHELAGERVYLGKQKKDDQTKVRHEMLKASFFKKIRSQVFKDYIFFPLLCWPVAIYVLLANLMANLIRNLWASTIIFCGHFTEEVQTFSQSGCENESRGHWYYRQMLGSSNFTGPRWLHILSGHLSYQIEHHLFPNLPACRYPEAAVFVREIAKRYGIPYHSGSFLGQYWTVIMRILRYSFPTPKRSLQP